MHRPRCSMKLPKIRRSTGPSRRSRSIPILAMTPLSVRADGASLARIADGRPDRNASEPRTCALDDERRAVLDSSPRGEASGPAGRPPVNAARAGRGGGSGPLSPAGMPAGMKEGRVMAGEPVLVLVVRDAEGTCYVIPHEAL